MEEAYRFTTFSRASTEQPYWRVSLRFCPSRTFPENLRKKKERQMSRSFAREALHEERHIHASCRALSLSPYRGRGEPDRPGSGVRSAGSGQGRVCHPSDVKNRAGDQVAKALGALTGTGQESSRRSGQNAHSSICTMRPGMDVLGTIASFIWSMSALSAISRASLISRGPLRFPSSY